MKYTVIGDPHCTLKNLDKIKQLLKQVEEIGYPTVFMGDLLDTKEVVRSKCLNTYYEYFKTSKLNHILLVGNHDWHNLECLDHSLQVLKSLPNVLVVDTPMTVNEMVFLPYYKDVTKLKETMKYFKNASTLFCHIDVSGFDYGNGHLCEDGLSLEDLKDFGLVISGHFHKHQVMDNLIYIGTPFSHSFGETDQNKVIGIFDSETNKIDYVSSPFPRHVTFKLHLENVTEGLDEFIASNLNNIKRVQLYGPVELCAQFDKQKYCKYDIKFEDKSETFQAEGVNLDETLDNKTQFMTWAKDIKQLDQETVTLGLSILEALSAKRA